MSQLPPLVLIAIHGAMVQANAILGETQRVSEKISNGLLKGMMNEMSKDSHDSSSSLSTPTFTRETKELVEICATFKRDIKVTQVAASARNARHTRAWQLLSKM